MFGEEKRPDRVDGEGLLDAFLVELGWRLLWVQDAGNGKREAEMMGGWRKEIIGFFGGCRY